MWVARKGNCSSYSVCMEWVNENARNPMLIKTYGKWCTPWYNTDYMWNVCLVPPSPLKKKKKKKEKSGVLGDKTPHMQHIVKMLHTGKKDATIKKKK